MQHLLSPQRINCWCTYLVLVLVNIAYCPGIIHTPYYKLIMAIIISAIAISISVNLKGNLNFALSLYLYYGAFALLLCGVTFLFSDIFIFNATLNIFLTITCFLLGYCSREHSKDFILKCLKIYTVSALFLGLYSVYTNLGGFIITEQYVFKLKNSSGVLLGTAIVLSIFIIDSAKNKLQTLIWNFITLLLCACLLTFRCRTAIVAIAIFCIVYAYKKRILHNILKKPLTVLLCIILISTLFYFDIIPYNFIYDSLFANTDTSSLDSISSGRLSHYDLALQVFFNDPIFGSTSQNVHLPSIDNFVINILGRYGLNGALLMFPPYILAWIVCLHGIVRQPVQNSYPFFSLLIICLVSFTESPFPFGPGTPVVCAWFLLGWWYKSSKLKVI